MADSSDQGDKNKMKTGAVDLTDLQNFNFATNWSEAPAAPSRRGGGDRDSSGRRDSRPDRRPSRQRSPEGGAPRDGGGERREGAPGRGGPPSGGDRRERRPSQERRFERPPPPLWRDSPFDVQVYPEDAILTTLTRAMRQSLRTYELFEIAGLVLEKPERFHINIRFKEGREEQPSVLYQSVPDGLPFSTEEGAVDHVLRNHVDKFFTVAQVEGEAPKGSFLFMARCNLTREFLCPPNFHRYQSILLQYHQDRFPDMPFEQFRNSVETVKDEEAVEKWLESMKIQTHYKVAGQEDGEVFDSLELARTHLLKNNRENVVRVSKVVRLPGKQLENLTDPAMKPFIESAIDHQKRFPLDTANGLRGRLRRQDFFIYKKGARGVSYVCAAKRKFRQADQTFSDSVEGLIQFVEANDLIPASELAEKFLLLPVPAEGEEVQRSPEDEEKLKKTSIDLRWLLSEGYVTELSDGRLHAHPADSAKRAPAPQKEKKPDEKSEKVEIADSAPNPQQPEAAAEPKAEEPKAAAAADPGATAEPETSAAEAPELSTEPVAASEPKKVESTDSAPEEETAEVEVEAEEEESPAVSDVSSPGDGR